MDGGALLRSNDEALTMRHLMATYDGRAFVWWRMELTGASDGRSSFAGEATHSMAYQEGMRHVGVVAEEKVFTTAPETYMIMRTEAQDRQFLYDHEDRGEEE